MNIRKWIDYIYPNEQFASEVETILDSPLQKQFGSKLLGILTEHYIPTCPSDAAYVAKLAYDELLHNVEVLARLEKALGNWLSFEECVALAHVLNIEHFVCEDGFIINDLRDDGMTIGKREGAALASCFHLDPDVKYAEVGYGKIESIELFNEIREKILKTHSARLVDYKDLW